MTNGSCFLGITCLFIASKVEEIYPPKLTEFAYVTDKACKAEQILDMELVILKTIDWNLASVTAYAWLNLYTQICNTSGSSSTSSSANSSNSGNTNATNYSFVFPNHSIKEFLQSSQLLDLCVLDEGSLRFPYSILAASCIYLTSYTDQILRISGKWNLTFSHLALLVPIQRSCKLMFFKVFNGLIYLNAWNGWVLSPKRLRRKSLQILRFEFNMSPEIHPRTLTKSKLTQWTWICWWV